MEAGKTKPDKITKLSLLAERPAERTGKSLTISNCAERPPVQPAACPACLPLTHELLRTEALTAQPQRRRWQLTLTVRSCSSSPRGLFKLTKRYYEQNDESALPRNISQQSRV